MPSVQALGLHGNPSAEPLTYPGNAVISDSLLVGDWLYSLAPESGVQVRDWSVRIDGGPISEASSVDDVLSGLGAPVMRDRVPCVAVGSNASPGQLLHKFGTEVPAAAIPITMMRFRGIAVGYSAHVSKAGYIPYAPMAGESEAPFCVLWLAPDQISRLDKTEPNYTPTVVQSAGVMVTGERRQGVVAYRGRWGVLRQPSGSPLPASGQVEVFGELLRSAWFGALLGDVLTVEQVVTRLAGDQDLRTRIREGFAAHGWSTDDGLAWE